ncbi:hypothetical protein C8F01DRAFT_1110446 [Mycena amicta]|nr:hypothetical protein C8F01DRAFT_1110446 [Mycena amicta]
MHHSIFDNSLFPFTHNKMPADRGSYRRQKKPSEGDVFAKALDLQDDEATFKGYKKDFRHAADQSFNFALPLFQQKAAMTTFVQTVKNQHPSLFDMVLHPNHAERLKCLERYAISYMEKSGKLKRSVAGARRALISSPSTLKPTSKRLPESTPISSDKQTSPRIIKVQRVVPSPTGLSEPNNLPPPRPLKMSTKPPRFPPSPSPPPMKTFIRAKPVRISIDDSDEDDDDDVMSFGSAPRVRAPAVHKVSTNKIGPPSKGATRSFLGPASAKASSSKTTFKTTSQLSSPGCKPPMNSERLAKNLRDAGVVNVGIVQGITQWEEQVLRDFLFNNVTNVPLEVETIIIGVAAMRA